jgi:sodium-independent sulfate anion transporter 11
MSSAQCLSATHNPHTKVEPFVPGVFVYRLEESFTYPNSSFINSALVDYIKEHTRRGKDISDIRLIDRPWNESGPRNGIDPAAHDMSKPLLHAIVLDFSAVPNVDTTGVQNLIDTRKELEKWADAPVEFHFANILSPWVRRALLAGGFGIGDGSHIPIEVAPVVPAHDQEYDHVPDDWKPRHAAAQSGRPTAKNDLEGAGDESSGKAHDSDNGRDGDESSSEGLLVSGLTPFFHVDLRAAVRAAEASATRKESKN